MDALLAQWLGGDPERSAPAFFLVLARVGPLAIVAPWLGLRGTVAVARIVLALALAAVLTPVALRSAPALNADGLSIVVLAIREVLIGAAFAIAASIPIFALQYAGTVLDRLRGHDAEDGPLETLHLLAAVALFVALGGPRTAIAAFARGLREAPIGSAVPSADLASFALGAVRLFAIVLELTVAFAAPAVIAFVLLELALALGARVAPSIRAWLDALPLRAALSIASALVVLAATLPRLAPIFARSLDAAGELARRLAS